MLKADPMSAAHGVELTLPVESRCSAVTVGLRIAVAAPFGWRWDLHPLKSAALSRRRAVLGEQLLPVMLEIALERRRRLRSQFAR